MLSIYPFFTFSITPMETSENRKVFWCFQEVEKGRIGKNGLKPIKVKFLRHHRGRFRTLSNTAQKMKFTIKVFFSKCGHPQFPADLVTFTEEILNGKLHFLYSDIYEESPPQIFDRTRSSHQRCFVKKTVLKNFAVFTGKHLCWSLTCVAKQLYSNDTSAWGISCKFVIL